MLGRRLLFTCTAITLEAARMLLTAERLAEEIVRVKVGEARLVQGVEMVVLTKMQL